MPLFETGCPTRFSLHREPTLTKATKMRQEKRKELTREKILNAARAVFAQKGYGGTSIADIVKKSKLARGTFYLHFQSVEQVLNALLQEIFIDIQRYLTDMQVEALDQKNFKIALSDLAKSLL